MAKTPENLREAFAGESQANRMYLAFARKAEEEGYPLVARRFRVAAASETVHAMNHFETMGGIESTADNLRTAAGGENEEHTSMYPGFMKDAEDEGDDEARRTFYQASEAEKFHEQMFNEAFEDLDSVPDKAFFVCQVCGMTYEDEPPAACVVCGAPRSEIHEVE